MEPKTCVFCLKERNRCTHFIDNQNLIKFLCEELKIKLHFEKRVTRTDPKTGTSFMLPLWFPLCTECGQISRKLLDNYIELNKVKCNLSKIISEIKIKVLKCEKYDYCDNDTNAATSQQMNRTVKTPSKRSTLSLNMTQGYIFRSLVRDKESGKHLQPDSQNDNTKLNSGCVDNSLSHAHSAVSSPQSVHVLETNHPCTGVPLKSEKFRKETDIDKSATDILHLEPDERMDPEDICPMIPSCETQNMNTHETPKSKPTPSFPPAQTQILPPPSTAVHKRQVQSQLLLKRPQATRLSVGSNPESQQPQMHPTSQEPHSSLILSTPASTRNSRNRKQTFSQLIEYPDSSSTEKITCFVIDAKDDDIIVESIIRKDIFDDKSEQPPSKKQSAGWAKTWYCELCNEEEKEVTNYSGLRNHIERYHSSGISCYICPDSSCDKSFKAKVFLKKHLEFHEAIRKNPSTRLLACEECDIIFSSKKGLLRHKSWHPLTLDATRRHSKCHFCKHTSMYPNLLRDHEISNHWDELSHKCGVCGAKFTSAIILETHTQSHSPQGPYSCFACEETKTFGHWNEIDDHLIEIHIPSNPPRRKIVVLSPPSETDLTCKICGQIYRDRNAIRRHTRERHEKKMMSYACDLCPNRSFSNTTGLTKHLICVHEKSKKKHLSCPRCSKRFATKYMMNRHEKGHLVEKSKPLSCEICELRFPKTETEAFKRHLKTHSRSRLQKCSASDCNRTFDWNALRLEHERQCHPELFIYVCDICDKKYSVKMFLDTHLKTHGQGPFDCMVTFCNIKFCSGELLAEHMKMHTGEKKLKCEKCLKTLLIQKHLRVHMIEEHNIFKPFLCTLCDLRFKSISLLRQHTKLKHKTIITPSISRKH